MKIACSSCELEMAQVFNCPDDEGQPTFVFVCVGCGGRVAVQDTKHQPSGRRPLQGLNPLTQTVVVQAWSPQGREVVRGQKEEASTSS